MKLSLFYKLCLLGDILIHSGDFTNTGTLGEVEDFDNWLGSLPHHYKVVVPGNHDSVMDPLIRQMVRDGNLDIYDQTETEKWEELKKNNNETLLQNGEVLINRSLQIAGLNICGSPHTVFDGLVARNNYYKYGYSFGYSQERGVQEQLDKLVCHDYDILVTHSPPQGIADIYKDKNKGSQALREAVFRLNPALHIFGHVHPHGGNAFKLGDCPENRSQISSTGYEDQGLHNLQTTFVNAASLKTSGVGFYKKGDLRPPVVVDIDRDSKQVFFREL